MRFQQKIQPYSVAFAVEVEWPCSWRHDGSRQTRVKHEFKDLSKAAVDLVATAIQCRRRLSRWSMRLVWWNSSGGKSVIVGDSVSFKIALAMACNARQRGQSSSGA